MKQYLALSALVLLSACKPAETTEMPEAQAEAKSGVCADGSVRLEGTKLCQSEAKALMVLDPKVRTPELENCQWRVNEAILPGDEAVLYSAATCGGVMTKLGFSSGARSADLAYEHSALYGEKGVGRVMIKLFGVEPDPQGALKAALAELPAKGKAGCEIRLAKQDGKAADVLVLAPKADVAARLSPSEQEAFCGPMGESNKTVRYWRVKQGYAWFFDLGDRDPDFDAGNMVVVTKSASGAWTVKP